MITQFKDSLRARLVGKIDNDSIEIVLHQLDEVAKDYSIELAHNELVVYQPGDLPMEYKLFIAFKKARNEAKGTIERFEYYLKPFLCAVRKPVKDITEIDITGYIYMYSASHSLMGSTQDKLRQTICTFFNWCGTHGYIVKNPAPLIEKIKFHSEPKKVIEKGEIRQMRDCATNLRDKVLLNVLACSGCRLSEVTNLKIKDIDFDKHRAYVFGKGGKYRYIPLDKLAIESIQEYLAKERKGNSEYLLVADKEPYEKLSTCTTRQEIAAMSRRSGVSERKHVTPHNFRHTFITENIKDGEPLSIVQNVVGHSSSATTDRYTHIDNSYAVEQILDKIYDKDQES